MKAIGIHFAQNNLRHVTLLENAGAITIVSKGKLVYPAMDIPSLMEWFQTQLNLLIDKQIPDKIGYKVSLSLESVKQIQQSCYPQGILNLIAKQKELPIFSWTSKGINATKFGQPKSVDVYSYVDTILGSHPPYWDKPTKDALLTAWFTLL